MRDKRLPETEGELREWITQAWEDGWKNRGMLSSAPLGTRVAEKGKRLQRFLQGWDLER